LSCSRRFSSVNERVHSRYFIFNAYWSSLALGLPLPNSCEQDSSVDEEAVYANDRDMMVEIEGHTLQNGGGFKNHEIMIRVTLCNIPNSWSTCEVCGIAVFIKNWRAHKIT
jgi:hypothetical protein